MKPLPPEDETARLAAHKSFKILDSSPEKEFDDIARLAALTCDTPISMICLGDETHLWWKACIGIESVAIPPELAFCAHTILNQEILVVPDATADRRFAQNPLVTDCPYIRFYAGVPLATPTGTVRGALCVIDREPRTLTPTQQEALTLLGQQAVFQFELRRDLTKRSEHERHLEQQRRLTRIAAAINLHTPLSETLRMVYDAVVEVGPVDRAGIYVIDAEHQLLRETWGTDRAGNRTDREKLAYALSDNRINALLAVATGGLEYYLLEDFTAYYNLSPDNPMYGVHAHAIVPLRAGSETLGALCVDNLLSDAPITEEDIRELQPFAEQAAIAIKNEHLFKQLRQVQKALVQSEKLRAAGELASGVAHNINNILMAVLGYAELIQDEAVEAPLIKQYAQIIAQAASDGADITRRMKQFAQRKPDHGMIPVDLALAVQEAVALARPALQNEANKRGARIKIDADLPPDLSVLGSASAIREVVLNLITNAVEAMPAGGALTVRCRPEDTNAVIEVTDTGMGMTEMTRLRVFEPFFTTKGPSLGLGLGLSVAWGIVERHHGRIEVQSQPGAGSTFRVYLPLAS